MLLRRLLAAVLALTIAVPLPALAGGGCQMDEPMVAAAKCDCCTSPATATTGGCATAMPGSGCGCSLRADTGSQPSSVATGNPAPVQFDIDVVRIPAESSTPRRSLRRIDLAASPPGAGASVSRSVLCSWVL